MRQNHARPYRRSSRGAGFFKRRHVRPGELAPIMNKHILTGTLGGTWGNLLAGIVYIYFGNSIGMSQLEWGILSGVGAWVVIVQPLGTIMGERAGSRRQVWFWTALTDRLLRMVAIVAAFLLWRAGYLAAYLVFMAGICVGTLIGNLSPGPWYGWLATIIPKEIQGTFWGRRDSWISLVIIAVTLPSGLLMDLVPEGSKFEMSAIVLFAASVLGLIDVMVHVTIPEPPHPMSRSGRTFAGMLVPLKDKRFRPWLVFTAGWNFSQGLGGSLCTLYFLENLGFKDNFIGGMVAVTELSLVGTLIAARKAGRMVDRFGIRRVLMLGYVFWSILPVLWIAATPRTAILWVGLASLIGGAFSGAANNAGIKLVTRFPPPGESGMYMAVSTVVGSITQGFSAIIAGVSLSVLGSWSVAVFGLVLSAFPLLFIVSFVLRMVSSVVLIPRIKVTGATPDDEQPFLLPLFFEGVPGITRIMRIGRGRKP
jgi:hypothetical protein